MYNTILPLISYRLQNFSAFVVYINKLWWLLYHIFLFYFNKTCCEPVFKIRRHVLTDDLADSQPECAMGKSTAAGGEVVMSPGGA